MRIIDLPINDKGSRYAVAGGVVIGREGVQAFLKELRREKRFAKASHNSFAALLSDGPQIQPMKGDDGEAGAGNIILAALTRINLTDHVIVVTRWYGGTPLGGDRFRHITTAVQAYLSSLS